MKNVLVVALFLMAQVSFSQISKNLGDFDELKVFDRISVEILPSDQNKIVITGNRSSDVEVVNNNGQLKIRMKLEKLLDGEDIQVMLHSRGLRSVDASEGSYISGTAIKQSALDVTAKEGAEIKLTVEVNNLNVKSVTGGRVVIAGSATNQNINIGTGGVVEAKDLITSQTSVKISAGGEANVNATDRVDVNIKAGGEVRVYGNPKEIDEKITLGGSVKRVTR